MLQLLPLLPVLLLRLPALLHHLLPQDAEESRETLNWLLGLMLPPLLPGVLCLHCCTCCRNAGCGGEPGDAWQAEAHGWL